jgi:hypothetical protein
MGVLVLASGGSVLAEDGVQRTDLRKLYQDPVTFGVNRAR